MALRQLHNILPREQVGPVTGERYEFQYHQAAADALLVLDESAVICIHCEWHDDYVIEAPGDFAYRFHQVKTRGLQRGPWKLTDFFGHRRRANRRGTGKPPTSEAEISIGTRMLEHLFTFEDRCADFVFVTDAGINADFENLLDAVAAAADLESLSQEYRKVIASIENGLRRSDSRISSACLFRFLRRFSVRSPVGALGDLRACRTLIAARILDLSEVDLRISEAEKIGAELVSLVRTKSHAVFDRIPEDLSVLRERKGLVLDEVLRVLSLSPAGYRALRATGRSAVVSLSRLHRLCRESGIEETLIPHLCELKSFWDAWWVEQRHLLNRLDVLALRKDAGEALRLHAEGRFDLKGLRAVAGDLAARYRTVLTSTSPLTDEVVFGLILSVAVEAEQ